MTRTATISELIGKIPVSIVGAEAESEDVFLSFDDGSVYRMFHSQDCCEFVDIEDVAGDVTLLIGYPLTLAEEVSSDEPPTDSLTNAESETWTYYKLGCIKETVTIRWYGASNGYYSEEVSLECIREPTEGLSQAA